MKVKRRNHVQIPIGTDVELNDVGKIFIWQNTRTSERDRHFRKGKVAANTTFSEIYGYYHKLERVNEKNGIYFVVLLPDEFDVVEEKK